MAKKYKQPKFTLGTTVDMHDDSASLQLGIWNKKEEPFKVETDFNKVIKEKNKQSFINTINSMPLRYASILITQPYIPSLASQASNMELQQQAAAANMSVEELKDYMNGRATTSPNSTKKEKPKQSTKHIIKDIGDNQLEAEKIKASTKEKELAEKKARREQEASQFKEKQDWHDEVGARLNEEAKLRKTRFIAGLAAAVPNTFSKWLGNIRQGH